MPDYYVKFLGGAAEGRAATSASPRSGTAPTRPGSPRSIRSAGPSGSRTPLEQGVADFCASCPEFLAGSAFINKLRDGGIAVPGVSYTSIVTRNDELVVPYTSGIETAPNMTNLVVQQQCPLDQAEHVSMAADPVVAQDVLNALDPGHSAPVPCTVVLPLLGAPGYTGPPR